MLKSEESWERKEVVVWGLAPPPHQWFKIKERTIKLGAHPPRLLSFPLTSSEASQEGHTGVAQK